MPVVVADPVVPLSSTWTVEKVVNEVRTLISEQDNQKIHNSHIRNHLNIAISDTAMRMNTAKHPDYGIVWKAELEGSGNLHPSGLDWIDLRTPVAVTVAQAYERAFEQNPNVTSGSIIPHNHIWEISRITAKKAASGQGSANNVIEGNVPIKPIEVVANLANDLNNQYRQSILAAPHGSGIILHIGSEITTAYGTAISPPDTQYCRPRYFILWGYRQPLLDNLLAETLTGSSWTMPVDVPNKFIRLIVLLGQKMCLEQLSKQVDSNTSNEIIALQNQVAQQYIQEQQLERQRITEQKYGFDTRQ